MEEELGGRQLIDAQREIPGAQRKAAFRKGSKVEEDFETSRELLNYGKGPVFVHIVCIVQVVCIVCIVCICRHCLYWTFCLYCP